jgi:hypothetical protein
MIRNLILIAGATALGSGMQAQSLSPEVHATAGTHFSNSSGQIEFTIGEPVTATHTAGTALITQGFHQSGIEVSTGIVPATEDGITVFPNPVTTVVEANFTKSHDARFIVLSSISGAIISEQRVSGDHMEIDMSSLPSGTYLLSIRENEKTTRTYNLIKTN